jgi:hypothetical protein
VIESSGGGYKGFAGRSIQLRLNALCKILITRRKDESDDIERRVEKP